MFDASSGLYYDSSSGYFFDAKTSVYLYYNKEQKQYMVYDEPSKGYIAYDPANPPKACAPPAGVELPAKTAQPGVGAPAGMVEGGAAAGARTRASSSSPPRGRSGTAR